MTFVAMPIRVFLSVLMTAWAMCLAPVVVLGGLLRCDAGVSKPESSTALSIADTALTISVCPNVSVGLVKPVSVSAVSDLHQSWLSALTPAFGCGITHVVELGSEKEVQRVAARRIVTLVADHCVVGNGSKCQFPCDSMSKGATIARIDLAADAEHAVAMREPVGLPRPTLVGSFLFDFAPEPRRNRECFNRHLPPRDGSYNNITAVATAIKGDF